MCVCARMCVCETVQSKENSRVFSLEFAHTAHRLRKAEIISWLIVFTSLLDGTYRRPLATPPHASSSSSSSHTHVNSHPHMHTRGRKHTLEAHIIADLSVLFLICLAEQTHAWVSHTSQGHLLQFRHVYDALPVKRALFKAIYTPQMGPATALS